MPSLTYLPSHTPFSAEDIGRLDPILARSTRLQRAWLAGFLAGVDVREGPSLEAPAIAARAAPLMILYATESGNSEKLAGGMAKQARAKGFKPTLMDMADLDLSELANAGALAVIAATWGEGEPPSRAERAYHALMTDGAPRLDGVPFAVLALGDTAYPDFCVTGATLDARLAALGGTRVLDRIECDLDFAEPAKLWIAAAFDALRPPDAVVSVATPLSQPLDPSDDPQPVEADVLVHVNLNSSRSGKETVHVELGFAQAPLYEPGDALEVFASNNPAAVEELLVATGLTGASDLAEPLRTGRDITTLSLKTLETYAKITGNEAVTELVASGAARDWLQGRQLIDLVTAYPAELSAEHLMSLTRRLEPRAYSIASSRAETPDEAHLLVAAVRYEAHGRHREGVASSHIADRLKRGASLTVRLKPNRHFRLPSNDHDIIMVGPGTGVAPFRAFVQERRAIGASGRNWLFYGDRTSTHDFLYQLDWQDALADGSLSALDVAFSRDAPEKVYVQDRLWQRRRELVDWLDGGAHFYVCGDAKRMAKDVKETLIRVAADVKALSDDNARAWVEDLERGRRYLQDVY